MKVLGISGYFHDSSAALIEDGKVLFSCAEERLSLIKHDSSFPKLAIHACLSQTGTKVDELEQIVFFEEPYEKFFRVLTEGLARFPFGARSFSRNIRSWLSYKLWVKDSISRCLQISPRKISFVPHHLSHAAQGFCTSGFNEAAILVLDAVGEKSCTSLFSGRFADGLKLQEIESLEYPNSLGLLYAAFTAFCGFKVNDGECSTMALAAFGNPIYADRIRQICRGTSDGLYQIEPNYFDFHGEGRFPFTNKFINLFGEPRDPQQPWPFPQYYADIASSIQLVLEERILALAQRLQKNTGFHNLVMSGGVALNCVANSKILVNTGFQDFFIPPDPGDGGAAMGAALYYYFSRTNDSRVPARISPYLGTQYEVSGDIDSLGKLRLENMARFLKSDFSDGISIEHGDIVQRACDRLLDGQAIGWFEGRFESGPRALGHRSILMDPRNIPSHQKMSRSVKKRAEFRPYGFSITADQAHRAFDTRNYSDNLLRWMQTAVQINDDYRDSLKGTIHVDGSSRPQVVYRDCSPRYHDLLKQFGEATGLAALTNTSFNEAGAPLVSSPLEAFAFFLRSDLDALVVEDYLIAKKRL